MSHSHCPSLNSQSAPALTSLGWQSMASCSPFLALCSTTLPGTMVQAGLSDLQSPNLTLTLGLVSSQLNCYVSVYLCNPPALTISEVVRKATCVAWRCCQWGSLKTNPPGPAFFSGLETIFIYATAQCKPEATCFCANGNAVVQL